MRGASRLQAHANAGNILRCKPPIPYISNECQSTHGACMIISLAGKLNSPLQTVQALTNMSLHKPSSSVISGAEKICRGRAAAEHSSNPANPLLAPPARRHKLPASFRNPICPRTTGNTRRKTATQQEQPLSPHHHNHKHRAPCPPTLAHTSQRLAAHQLHTVNARELT